MECLLLLALAGTALAASNCSITPIYVDFHDRCVDDCFTIQYGLFIGIGSPFQNESLWPSLSRNETTFSGGDFCADGSSAQCVNQSHGLYSPGVSNSFQDLQNYVALDNVDALTQGLTTVEAIGTDTLNIFTHYFDPSPPNVTNLPDMPIHVLANYSSPNSPWFGPSGILGLGSDSTILTLLHAADLISSRSFGLYVGTAYPRAGGAINGSLTLGGYDSGRFTGEAVEYELSPPAAFARDPTPYRVEVASVSLTNADNETTVLSEGAFDAYLTISQYEITLPPEITSTFASLTSAAPASDDLASSISPNVPPPLVIPSDFSGALTITLSSGLEITLETSTGELRNISNLSPISSQPDTTNETPRIPLLGTAALAHLYLTTTYSSSNDPTPAKFYLNPASPHGPYVVTQPLCPNQTPESYTSPRISSFERNGTIGAILGGAIGGIGLTFAIWWGVRKYLQRREHKRWEAMYGEGSGGKGKNKIGEEAKGDYDVDEEGLKVLAGLGSSKSNSNSNSKSKSRSIFTSRSRSKSSSGGDHSDKDVEMGEVRKPRFKGLLKPDSATRDRKINRARNPISALRAEMNSFSHEDQHDSLALPGMGAGMGTGERSISSAGGSSSASGSGSGSSPPRNGQQQQQYGEEYDATDLSQLSYALPPGTSLDALDPDAERQGQGQGQRGMVWPLGYSESSQSQHRQHPQFNREYEQEQHWQQQHQQQSAGLMRDRSTSRSRSPSPIFTPSDDGRMSMQQQQTIPSASFPRRAPSTTSISTNNVSTNKISNPFSDIPLTPETGNQQHQQKYLHPSVSNSNSKSDSTLKPLHLSQPQSLTPQNMSHHRSPSQESLTRRDLGLTINTYFEGPPSSKERVGKKFRVGKDKEGKEGGRLLGLFR